MRRDNHLDLGLDEGDDEDEFTKDVKHEEIITLVLGLRKVMMRMMTGRM